MEISMIERVARKLAEQEVGIWVRDARKPDLAPVKRSRDWSAIDPQDRARYKKRARELVAAMRDPTVRMVDAAASEDSVDIYLIWNDLIDAALEEEG